MIIPSNIRQKQNGNALFIILIGIVLFGALSFVVSQMMQGGGGANINDERVNLEAQSLLSYGDTIRRAIQMVMIDNGCAESEISFEKSPYDGSDAAYVNVSAPSDFSCHIFHPLGGGVTYLPPAAVLTSTALTTQQAHADFGVYKISGQGRLSTTTGSNTWESGSGDHELWMIVGFVNNNICAAFNENVGVAAPTDDIHIGDHAAFTGSFGTAGAGLLVDAAPLPYNANAYCVTSSKSPGGNHVYQVLMSR